MKKIISLLLLLFPACLWAYDFGLALNQDFGVGGAGEVEVDYSAALVPWFSTSLGNSGDMYVSAGFAADYEYKVGAFFAELLHTEFSRRFNNLKIRLGRIPYADPLDFILEGLFDGAQILYDTVAGTFNVGAWYTGLLYKRSANITISPEDFISYYNPLDYSDFSGTYFASRRMVMALGWEHPALAGNIRAGAALSGQVDLNDTDTPYNSVYLSGKAAIPVKQAVFQAGVCMQIGGTAGESGVGFAGELGVLWALPTPFASRLSLIGRLSSGKTGNLEAFVPVTTKVQGDVLQAKLSGISAFFLDYTARLHPALSAGLTASFFTRNDLETYWGYPVTDPGNGSYALGGEFFGRFIWSPLSDVNLNLGAGIFLPAESGTDPMWRVELGLALILY